MRLRGYMQRLLPSGLAARLTLLATLTATLSVSIAATSMLVIGWKGAESGARADARQDARAIAFSLSAPLAFVDRAGTQEVLALLAHRPNVMAAWVRDRNGRLLLSYGGSEGPAPLHEGGSLREGELVVIEPVVAGRNEDQVGSLTMRIDLRPTVASLRSQAAAAAIASLLALVLTVMLSRQMARRLSVPVVRLAEAAAALTRDWSNPRRLAATGPGEIGVALEAYNHMVDELGRRDAAVQKLTDELRDTAAAADVARQQAESASLAKTRFLANMSHELRSPLNGVIGAAQLLRNADADPAFRDELIHIIQTSGTNLLELIEGVLDVSRIEAGKVQVEQQPFNLVQCVEAALAPAAAGAAVKGLELECQIDADVPGWCVGDASRLKQLLQNLLGNAVKFTEAGAVSLSVARDASSGQLRFGVADTGVGIAPHLLESIFEPFQQGDPSATRRFGGSGLGLTICRDVARLMKGTVQVESTPGEGSRFTLLLPLPAVAHAAGPPALRRLRLFCYEPATARRNSLAALLQRLGCRARFFEDIDAVRAAIAKPVPAGEAVDAWLVAVDAGGGPEVVGLVRSVPHAPPVVALGNAAAGLDVAGSLGRPITLSALQEAVTSRNWISGPAELSETSRTQTLRAQVLLVEDDAVNRLVVSSLLSGKELECAVAVNGTDALRKLECQRFDAVLMDWQMPDMDGLEVTRRLRAGVCGELNRAVPVIALTANAFAEDRNACLAAGMNDFLTKPVQLQALRQCVLRWCRHVAVAAEDAAPAQPASPRQPAQPAAGEMPAYDPAVLASLHADGCVDAGEIQNLLQLFCSTARTSLRAMEAAVAARDWPTLQRQAHTLKSSGGQVGAMAMSRRAAAMEGRLRSGEAGSAADVAQLRQALDQFAASAGLVAGAT